MLPKYLEISHSALEFTVLSINSIKICKYVQMYI